MTELEIKSAEFPRYVHIQYEEMTLDDFFDAILPFTRTPHKCYRTEQNTFYILIGVTHPIEIKITVNPEKMEELEKKLRTHGFKKARWEWK